MSLSNALLTGFLKDDGIENKFYYENFKKKYGNELYNFNDIFSNYAKGILQ
ncbi:MAG TPA: hypothetical protein PLL00_01820 [Bacteroidia bacterium]|nr:hypothetical protein [Bacteroidia bacterium]